MIHLNMETLRNVSLFGLLSLVLTLSPLVMALAYAIRPSERRPSRMRCFPLVGLFAALTGAALGFINVLRYVGMKREMALEVSAIGAAESLVTLFVCFWLFDRGLAPGCRRNGTAE